MKEVATVRTIGGEVTQRTRWGAEKDFVIGLVRRAAGLWEPAEPLIVDDFLIADKARHGVGEFKTDHPSAIGPPGHSGGRGIPIAIVAGCRRQSRLFHIARAPIKRPTPKQVPMAW